MPRFSVGSVIICDDVRKEVSNKEILIGVYGGGILVPSFPVQIPMAVWMEITPEEIGHFEIDFKITLPGNPAEFQMRVILDVQTLGESTTIYTPSITCMVGKPGN